MVEVFFDRVVVSSPGSPPQPLTLAKLRRGKYRPCSRNPVVAQSLALLKLMEQRGSGLARMKAAMLDHGFDAPEFDMVDGYFQVVLLGPKDDLDRLRVPAGMVGHILSPSVEEQLNERQKKILAEAVHNGHVTTTWCVKMLGVVKDTASRDFNKLIAMGLLKRTGKGRSTKYILNISENNRPIIDR